MCQWLIFDLMGCGWDFHPHPIFLLQAETLFREVDYLIDDYDSLFSVPIEVKSGKDYTVHSALNAFVQNEDYHIKKAFVLSNEREVVCKGKIIFITSCFFVLPLEKKNMQF